MKDVPKLERKSASSFFADNSMICGFDAPGKCLYTTVRELVENSLDAAEEEGALPDIGITIEEISQKRLNTLRGIENVERVDAELYKGHEREGEKKKRLAKEAKELAKAGKAAALKGEGGEGVVEAKKRELEQKRADKGAAKVFYKITVQDNGSGMKHAEIPELLGRVLSGTKYGVKQTRGKFGLGAKMALIWSKLSTGLPIEVWSAREGQSFTSHYKLDINIEQNEPNVHLVEELPNNDWRVRICSFPKRQDSFAIVDLAHNSKLALSARAHKDGSKLSVTIHGAWPYFRSKVLRYLRLIAVITPYAAFRFSYIAEDAKSSFSANFLRRTDKMPNPPQATLHHPSSVDLELVKRLAASTTAKTLTAFLSQTFSSVTRDLAGRLIEELGGGQLAASSSPRSLTAKQLTQLHQLLHEARFPNPDGAHLSPAGEYNLRLGVVKELHPDLIATHQGEARVLSGHSFVVESAVCLGGRDLKPGITVHRFANRIPLLFEAGSDVCSKTATKRINWTAYKMNASSDKVGVFVSIVSTKIPYKGAGKEYIADDYQELQTAVKHALQQCCLQLKAKIVRQQAAKERKQRRKNLTKFVPSAAAAIFKVLTTMAYSEEEPGPKRRKVEEQSVRGKQSLLEGVRDSTVLEKTLASKLSEHVEKVDTEALEYQVQQKGAQLTAFLAPRTEVHRYEPGLPTACGLLAVLDSH